MLILKQQMQLTTNLLKEALHVTNLPEFIASGVSIDTRTIKAGDIFIAINRGHEFVSDAIKAGASLAVIDDPKYAVPGKTVIVNNTTEALKSIGSYIKNKVNLKKLVAITGSIGKTTTKFWLNSILSHKYKSFCGIKNYNTVYGVPLALCQLDDDADFGVFEIGSSHSGEILELSQYLTPDVGVITNIYESHIGNFGDKQSLAKEKISIIDGIKPNGALIFDGNSEFASEISKVAKSKNLNTLSVGFLSDCDFYITSYNKIVKLVTPSGMLEYTIPFQEKHCAYITATIIATIYAMGLNPSEFLPFFSELSRIAGRGNIEKYTFRNRTFEVINDCYNASPTAVLAALDTLQAWQSQSKVAVIGQMKELGQYEQHYHNVIANKLSSMDLNNVFFIGDKTLWATMRQCKKVQCFERLDKFAIEKILEVIQNGSVVLLKGSLSVGLKQFIEYIKCSLI